MPNTPEQRTAVADGNAGYVSAPSVRHTAVQNTRKRNMSVDPNAQVISDVSTRLGSAFTKYAKDKTAHVEEQQRLSGVAKSWMKRSMDEVDVDVKQTDFTDFIFGEDVEYRAAQQQVITNGVEAKYREEMANIDQYQGYTEKEYGAVVKESLNQLADQYQDDPETKALATNTWIKAAGRLVGAQHKSHFAYKQHAMAEGERTKTNGRIEQLLIEEGDVSSPQDVSEYNSAWDSVFSVSSRTSGMSEVAKQQQLYGSVEAQLKGGNITAYKQARLRGFYNDASNDTLGKLDTAIGTYDVGFNRRVNTTIEETVAAMQTVETVEDAQEMLTQLAGSIDIHETRQSGSDKSKNTVAEARARVSKLIAPVMKKAAANATKAENIESVVGVLEQGPGLKEGIGLHPYTKSEVDAGRDIHFANTISELTGEEDLTPQEASMVLAEDSDVGKRYADKFAAGEGVVPILQSGLTAMLDGVESMTDPDTGATTDEWGKVMTFMSGLDATGSARLSKTLGSGYAKFKFFASQTRARVPGKTMQANWNKLQENLSDKGAYGGTLNRAEGQSRRDFILEAVNMTNLDANSSSTVVKYFEEGLAIHNGDVNLARDYVQTVRAGEAVTVGGGVLLQDTGRINSKLSGGSIKDLLEWADSNPRVGKELVRNIVGDVTVPPRDRNWFGSVFGDDRKPTVPTKLSQINGLNITVDPYGDGLIVSSAGGRVRRLPMSILNGMQSDKNKQAAERQAITDSRTAFQIRAQQDTMGGR